ncbi:MAG: adenosylhomocysteinase [Deltaproteobacteria bacterium]|nr:adenosylhomocysteinase [Deltaproteobacteria bacterium]
MAVNGRKVADAPARFAGEGEIADPGLADAGFRRVERTDDGMPVLRAIRAHFEREKPLQGQRIGACLHVTAETANLLRALKAGGAAVACCASNPLSTQDDVAAALVKKYAIPVFAVRGEDRDRYYAHMRAVLESRPTLVIDDGADLISQLHTDFRAQAGQVLGAMEETTTGVIRLRAMERDGALAMPVVAVNDAQTKYLFDNRYGTGQSTLDAIMRVTDMLIAGSVFVVCGYGWCGRGVAMRARGLGAQVVVTEVAPLRALEAALDGFQVMPMRAAARLGDIFTTATGDRGVIGAAHFPLMKDGAVLANAGHFDVEIDVAALRKMTRKVDRDPAREAETFHLPNGRRLHLLGQGRLVNLACATGHPPQVMDMSFATQALSAQWVARSSRLPSKVHEVPANLVERIAALKLKAMGVRIDALSAEQKRYLASWQSGT